MLEEMKAFKEGQEAAKSGKKNNPYKRYTKEEAWDAGFNSKVAEEPLTSVGVMMVLVIAAELAFLTWVLLM